MASLTRGLIQNEDPMLSLVIILEERLSYNCLTPRIEIHPLMIADPSFDMTSGVYNFGYLIPGPTYSFRTDS